MNIKKLVSVSSNVVPDLKIKGKPQGYNIEELRNKSLIKSLGQSNKDYLILQNSLNHKPAPATEKDIQAAKNFFKSTYAVLKDFLKA